MEITIKVTCEALPPPESLGAAAGARRDIYLGIQRGEAVIEAAPIEQNEIVFEPVFRVAPLPEDRTNFLGPFAKGTPAERFFYLVWLGQEAGTQAARLGRVKVHLSHLRWPVVEAAAQSGKPLSVKLSLADEQGRPRFASIQGEAAVWQLNGEA